MDKFKLKYEMDRKGISQDQLCEDLKISRSSFYRKCNGKSEFTLTEIQQITDYLQLESPMGIFFAEKVS